MIISYYFQALALNLFLNFGIFKLFDRGMILGFIGDWLDAKLPEWACKPLFSCPPCMSSVYGTLFFFAIGLHNILPFWLFPLHCVVLCGLTTIVMLWDKSNE